MTNSPIYGVRNRTIFAAAFFVRIRRVLDCSIRGSAEYLDARVNTAASLSQIACRLSSQAPDGLSVLGVKALTVSLTPFFPRLDSTGQYSSGKVSNVFPCSIRIGSKQIAVRFNAVVSQVKRPFTLSNFLRSFVFHVPINVMERIERYGKAFGDFKNDRRTSSVRNSSTEDRASWPLPVGSRTHTPRLP